MTARPILRRQRTALLVAFTALFMALLGPGVPAAAHAQLVGTDPADGTVLPTAPEQVTLTYNEPVRLVEDAVRVIDPAGSQVPVTTRAVDEQVIASIPTDVPEGTYVVSWRVVSADSHPISGAFTYSVGAPSRTVTVVDGEEDGGAAAASIVVQAAAYLGLFGAAGLVAFQVAVLPAGQRWSARARRVRRPALVAAVVAGIALLLTLPLADARLTGAGLGAVVDAGAWADQVSTDIGLSAWLPIAGLITAMPLIRRPRLGPMPSALALVGAGLAVSSLAIVGHTRTYGPSWLVVPSDVLHVACGAVWFGGLIGLWITLRDAEPVLASTVVARFSALAAFLVAGLSIAGVLLGWRIVGSWAALFGTTYGVALLVKVALAVVVVAVAGYNRYRLLPRMTKAPSWPTLRRTVRVEASVIVVILALTGFLVEQNPRAESPAATTSGSVTIVGDLGADNRAELTVTPGSRGQNTVHLRLTGAAGEPIAAHHPPTVRFTQPATEIGPFEHMVTATGPGTYEATVNLPLSGAWIVEVVVRISEFEEPIARLPIDVN